MLVSVFDHDDRRIDHRADRDRDAAEAHDIGAEAEQLHGAERHQDTDRQHQDRHQRAAEVQQEDDADQRYAHALLEKCPLQRLNGGIDEIRAVVDRYDLDRFRQATGDFLEALFHVLDHIERIDAEALQHDAARDLAFPIQFGNPAPLVGAKLDAGDVAQQNRRTFAGLEHDVTEIVDALQIPLAADDIFELRKLDGAAADVGVAGADRVPHLLHGDAEIAHALRIENHVVLADEAADACNLGDAFGLRECEFQVPVLNGTRVRKVQFLGHDRVLINPTDASGIRSYGRADAGR